MSRALPALTAARQASLATQETHGYVAMRVGDQLIGVSVLLVQDVLRAMEVTNVPLAPHEVAGLMNLRGRIVTVIDMRRRLGLASRGPETPVMHVVIEYRSEFYSMMVDAVGDVLNLPMSRIEKAPVNLEGEWRDVAAGVCRLEKELLILLDVQALLTV